MVGKRERDSKNPMRRTTSMTEFAPPDPLAAVMEDEEEAQLPDNSNSSLRGAACGQQDWLSSFGGGGGAGGAAAYRARAGLHRNSADYSVVETAAFLRACGLCRRRLGPGRDTFMYKGEAAFCSLECRERHITQEEWKDKCAVTSIKDAAAGAAKKANGRRAGSGKAGGTVAAA
ncbi:FCS-Like Zinc finger 6-like [Miscanthus floridulus]|uniref:FCS-Like Zinc finger 6-like n=1 Tax=Miscanthus floridulus TaxID=154761 RepID=UPI00345AF419